MPTVFGLGKILCGGLVLLVLGVNVKTVRKYAPYIATSQSDSLSTQIATNNQQITDLERRVLVLEQAKTAEDVAAIKSQLAIDHELLFLCAGGLVTLAFEAIYSMAQKKKGL